MLAQDFDVRGVIEVAAYPATVMDEWCQGALAGCGRYKFVVEADGDVTDLELSVAAQLTWSLPTNALDLFLYGPRGELLAFHEEVIPRNERRLSAMIGPGAHILEVVPYQAVREEYRLRVSFEE